MQRPAGTGMGSPVDKNSLRIISIALKSLPQASVTPAKQICSTRAEWGYLAVG